MHAYASKFDVKQREVCIWASRTQNLLLTTTLAQGAERLAVSRRTGGGRVKACRLNTGCACGQCANIGWDIVSVARVRR